MQHDAAHRALDPRPDLEQAQPRKGQTVERYDLDLIALRTAERECAHRSERDVGFERSEFGGSVIPAPRSRMSAADDVRLERIGAFDDRLDMIERHPGIAGVKVGEVIVALALGSKSRALAEKVGVPVLGICYGMQMIAVDLGGIITALDQMVKNAPAGSEVGIAAMKSTLAAVNSGFDNFTKVAKQLGEDRTGRRRRERLLLDEAVGLEVAPAGFA